MFAALNYGNRPHGSSTYYGFSYMVLKPGLKDNAIFFGGDTFYKSSLGTAAQASFNTVGAIIQFAVTKLQNALWDGCYNRQLLPDTDDGDYLVEAHLFKKLKIAEDVQTLVLSRLRESRHTPWTDAEWQGIIVNATKWCKRNHVMLVFASP